MDSFLLLGSFCTDQDFRIIAVKTAKSLLQFLMAHVVLLSKAALVHCTLLSVFICTFLLWNFMLITLIDVSLVMWMWLFQWATASLLPSRILVVTFVTDSKTDLASLLISTYGILLTSLCYVQYLLYWRTFKNC